MTVIARRRAGLRMLVCLCSVTGCHTDSTVHAARPVAAPDAFSFSGGFFAVSVADLDASARWYSEKLGMKVTMRSPATQGASTLVLENDGLIVELVRHENGVDLSRLAPAVRDRTRVHGIVKAGALVRDLDKALATLKRHRADIAYGPYPASSGQRANVIVRDNEGNLIQLLEGGPS